jgi:hypothetical protein
MFNIRPIPPEVLERLKTSSAMQGPSRSLEKSGILEEVGDYGPDTPVVIQAPIPSNEPPQAFFFQPPGPVNIAPPMPVPMQSPMQAPYQPPTQQQRPSAVQQAESMLNQNAERDRIEKQRNQERLQRMSSRPATSGYDEQAFRRKQQQEEAAALQKQQEDYQRAREQQMRQQQDREQLERRAIQMQQRQSTERQRQEAERQRQEAARQEAARQEAARQERQRQEAERQKQQEAVRQRNIEAERQRLEIEAQRQEQGRRNPEVLYAVMGSDIFRLQKNPGNLFEYWINPPYREQGVAELLNSDPSNLRIRWLTRFAPGSVFPAYLNDPKPKQQMSMELEVTPRDILTMEEREQLLSKQPILTSSGRREQPSGKRERDDQSISIAIAPELIQEQEQLAQKKQRLKTLQERLRDRTLMENAFKDLQTQMDILREQISIQTDLVKAMQKQWRDQKQQIANERVRLYREQMQREVERTDDNAKLVEASGLLQQKIEEYETLMEERKLKDPRALEQRYKNQVADLKKEVSVLEKLQDKVDVLKNIEQIANNIFKTPQKRSFVELIVHFPDVFQDYMRKKGAPKMPGQPLDPEFYQLTREDQIEALKLYLCGQDLAMDIHKPGFVEEVLQLDNRYCQILINP